MSADTSEVQPCPSSTSVAQPAPVATPLAKEIGGPKGPDPTRYGDWEHKGRCVDF